MSVTRIGDAARRVSADGVVDKKDVQSILSEAGSGISAKEEKALKDAFVKTLAKTLNPEAKAFAADTLKDIAGLRQYSEQQNAAVAARAPALAKQEQARLDPSRKTTSLGGTQIPDEVKKLVSNALAHGATAYDVAELDGPAKDDHGEGYTVAGKWSPYPQEATASGNMAFAYTEITPQKVKQDMETVQEFTVIKGYKDQTQRDLRTGETHTFQVAEYEKVTAKGNGNITSFYDEASHSDQYARARGGQKWSNNVAILSDGSLHALPVCRRNPANPGLILTNPSLARGQRMLFNGHLEMQGGVITGIGMSGRIQKLAAEGEAKFIDPVPLLKAWGFQVSPNVKVRFEGGGQAPKIDDVNHVIG